MKRLWYFGPVSPWLVYNRSYMSHEGRGEVYTYFKTGAKVSPMATCCYLHLVLLFAVAFEKV